MKSKIIIVLLIFVMLIFVTSCAHKHNFSDWQTSKEATCTSPEYKERICKCGEIETRAFGSYKPHTLGEWKTKTSATCYTLEIVEAVCSVCNKKETKTIGTYKEHTYGDWILEERTDCGNYLKQKRVCSVCNHTEDAFSDIKIEHEFSEWEYKDNKISRSCPKCNSVEEIDFNNAFPTDGNGSVEFVDIIDDQIIVKPVPNDGYYFLYWDVNENYVDNVFYESILKVHYLYISELNSTYKAVFTDDPSLILPITFKVEVENNLEVDIEYLPYVNKKIQRFSFYVHSNDDLLLTKILVKKGSFHSYLHDAVVLPYYLESHPVDDIVDENINYILLKFLLKKTE